jgi:hypothetical protein
MINVANVFTARSIAAGQSVVSQRYDNAHIDGYYSAQATIHSGVGTITIWAEMSNNGADFLVPTGETAIGSVNNAGGPMGNGKDIIEFSPVMSQFIRFRVESTGSVVFSLWIARQ